MRGAAGRSALSGGWPRRWCCSSSCRSWSRWSSHDLMPLTAYFLWLLVARILLSFRPLVVVATVNAIAGSLAILLQPNGMDTGRAGWPSWSSWWRRCWCSTSRAGSAARCRPRSARRCSGTSATGSRRRAGYRQLPEGWQSQTAMLASHGVSYAGDFLVADLREDRQLEVILVDVCGKGTGAGPAALQFAGALGGLIGSLPPGGAVPRGQRLPAPPERRRVLRHRGAPARRPGRRHLPDHQCRAPARAAPATCPPASG